MADNQIEATYEFIRDQLVNSMTRSDPVDGMKASAILFAVTFSSNFIGLLFTIILDVFFATLFVIHLIRYLWGRFR